MTAHSYNIIVVSMIPPLVPIPNAPWPVLPPGLHDATLDDVAAAFATNRRRNVLYDGLVRACGLLRTAGCGLVYLDGSFVTGKPLPGDYDACWHPAGINPKLMDPVFFDFDNGRAAQKKAFQGEFFPSTVIEAQSNVSFLGFFQVERFTGARKGILSIQLLNDPVLARRAP